jgi:hypothetical protein
VYPLVSFPALCGARRFIACSHKNSPIFPFLNHTNAVHITLMWLALRQAYDYWEDPPEKRRCVSLPWGRPLGRWGTLPSFFLSAPEIPRDPSNRPPTHVTHKTGTQSAVYSELRARERNSLGTRRADRNRAPTHIMAPHRSVPKGRGPRLSRQVKADLRYGRGLSPHIWFSDLKTLSPHTPLTTGRALPGLTVRSVSALRHRAPRDLSGDRPRSTRRRHTCSALLAQAARRFPSVRRFTQASPVTATGDLPRTHRLCRRQLLSGARPKPLLSGGRGRPLLRSAEGPVT